jgi:hypothetical protein
VQIPRTVFQVVVDQSGQANSEGILWTDYAPILAAAVSLIVSVTLGVLNRRTAKRALEISERQEARRDSSLSLHLNESVSWRSQSRGERLLGFHVIATNPTDRPTSLVASELRLTYTVDGILTTVKVPSASDVGSTSLPASIVPLEIPTRVDANDAVIGWFLFRIDDQLTNGRIVERYDFVLREVHGIEETLQVTVFREVADDEGS